MKKIETRPVNISKILWKKITIIKYDYGYKNVDEVVKEAIEALELKGFENKKI